MTADIKKRIKKIKLLAMDVDGVLTNGKINIDSKGKEIKVFDVQDGFGVAIIKKAGIKTAIITARSSEAVTARAKDLKVDFVAQDAYPKINAYKKALKKYALKDEEVCFIGDDLPDLCLLKRAGFAVAVKNAAPEVKKRAHYVTKNQGGDGALRELVELILRGQGKWQEIIHFYEG